MTIAANGRNHLVIRGVPGRPEGGRRRDHRDRQERGRRIGLLRHQLLEHGRPGGSAHERARHHRARGRARRPLRHQGPKDLLQAKVEIPSMFEAGITSIAIDASHLPDADNLLPAWSSIPSFPPGPAWRPRWARSRVARGSPPAPRPCFS